VITIDERTRDTIGLKVLAVEQRPFADVIQATGVVTPNETRVAHVRLLAPGRVEEVYVRVGDRVQSGQPMLTYDNVDVGELVGNYLSAAAAVDRAAADADVAKRALERATKLVDVGGLSRGEYERREAEHKRALAEVTTAHAAMTNIERRLQRFGLRADELTRLRASSGDATSWSRTTVRAPFAGVVTAADVAPGEAVDTQRELFTVVDLSTVWVIGDLYQKDIASVRRGQEAQITTESYSGETFIGRVTYISDVLDSSTRTAKVRCEVPNRDGRLKLQMFVTMGIPTATARDALVIPAAAVQQVDDDTVVFVQTGDDTFEKRVVDAGVGTGGWVRVLVGLKAGERVVTEGGFMLKSKLKAASIGEGGEKEEQEKRR
jgi:cobalt-zinc-cadmium efflux system membrane fusion protein